MKNKILPIALGIIAGFLCVAFFDGMSHYFYPVEQDGLTLYPPLNEGMSEANKEQFKQMLQEMMEKVPFNGLLIILIGWLIAGFVGGAVAAKMTTGYWKRNVLTVGFILFLATLANLLMIPHPRWMSIFGLMGILPLAYIGGLLFGEKE